MLIQIAATIVVLSWALLAFQTWRPMVLAQPCPLVSLLGSRFTFQMIHLDLFFPRNAWDIVIIQLVVVTISDAEIVMVIITSPDFVSTRKTAR